MVQFKLSKLNSIVNTFNKFAEQNLPIVMSYQIAKIMLELENEIQSFEQAQESLLKKYAVCNQDGSIKLDKNNKFTIPQDFKDEFYQEMQDLLDFQTTLQCEKISLSKLNQAGISISPLEMVAIADFIENDLE